MTILNFLIQKKSLKIFIQNYLIKGGHEYDGNEIVPLDTKSIEKIGLDLKKREIK